MSAHKVTVLVPSIPYGPEGIAPILADADYYESAASNIRFHARQGNSFAGSNVTETVAKLCEAVALTLRASHCTAPDCKLCPPEQETKANHG